MLDNPHCWLLVDGVNKPVLLFYRPVDFWHKVAGCPTPSGSTSSTFVSTARRNRLPITCRPTSRGGPIWAAIWKWPSCWDWASPIRRRSSTTCTTTVPTRRPMGWNVFAMPARIGVRENHIACPQRTPSWGASRFRINEAYMKPVGQGPMGRPTATLLPSTTNAAILHTTPISPPSGCRMRSVTSFLIDAGVDVRLCLRHYRTWAWRRGEFADLIAALDAQQQEDHRRIKPGRRYGELHLQMLHHRLARLLQATELVDMSVDEMIHTGVTMSSSPHGLGPLPRPTGTDVGGFMQDERSTHLAAPSSSPICAARVMEVGQVFTIEPGLYFIDNLLEPLRQGEQGQAGQLEQRWRRCVPMVAFASGQRGAACQRGGRT